MVLDFRSIAKKAAAYPYQNDNAAAHNPIGNKRRRYANRNTASDARETMSDWIN